MQRLWGRFARSGKNPRVGMVHDSAGIGPWLESHGEAQVGKARTGGPGTIRQVTWSRGGRVPEPGALLGVGRPGPGEVGRATGSVGRPQGSARWRAGRRPGPHRKYRSSSAFSLFAKVPPASLMAPESELKLADCGERHDIGKGVGGGVGGGGGTASALRAGAAATAAGLPVRSRSLRLAWPSRPTLRAAAEPLSPRLPWLSVPRSSGRRRCGLPRAPTATNLLLGEAG